MLRQILGEFLTIEGVVFAALAGRDGFVIESAGTPPPGNEALGPFGADAVRFFDRAGALTGMGPLRQAMIEYRDGGLLIQPVTDEEFLLVLTGPAGNPGRLAFMAARAGPRVAAAI